MTVGIKMTDLPLNFQACRHDYMLEDAVDDTKEGRKGRGCYGYRDSGLCEFDDKEYHPDNEVHNEPDESLMKPCETKIVTIRWKEKNMKELSSIGELEELELSELKDGVKITFEACYKDATLSEARDGHHGSECTMREDGTCGETNKDEDSIPCEVAELTLVVTLEGEIPEWLK